MKHKSISVSEVLWKKGVSVIAEAKQKGGSLSHNSIYKIGLDAIKKDKK